MNFFFIIFPWRFFVLPITNDISFHSSKPDVILLRRVAETGYKNSFGHQTIAIVVVVLVVRLGEFMLGALLPSRNRIHPLSYAGSIKFQRAGHNSSHYTAPLLGVQFHNIGRYALVYSVVVTKTDSLLSWDRRWPTKAWWHVVRCGGVLFPVWKRWSPKQQHSSELC